MSENTLKTLFVFDDLEASRRIDTARKNLFTLNNDFNNLGKNISFSKTVAADFNLAGKSIETFKNKVSDLEVSYKKTKSPKFDNDFKKITSDINKVLTDDLKKQSKEVDAINAQTLKNSKQQADFRNAVTRRMIDAEIAEEKRLDKYRQQSSRDLAARTQNSRGLGGGTGGFGDSFGNRVFGSDFGSAAFFGGLAGGAVVIGITSVTNAVSALTSEVKDLTVESIRLAGNFEETTNSLAVFAGSTSTARQELKAIDDIALKTPGLRLQDAEIGYQRLRALGFQAKISQDLIKGLGTQRVLSGASSDAVDRVITNLIQLKSGAGTAADVRQTVGQLPTLLPVFQKAFGTQDFGDINKIFKTDPLALQKFSDELAKAQNAQAGLNVTIEKGADTLIQAGRVFGEPFLQPLTRDVKDLTESYGQNESAVKKWGQSFADVYNGVSQIARGGGGVPGAGDALIKTGRGLIAPLTAGISEILIGGFNFAEYIGKNERETTEAARQQGVKASVSFTEAFAGQYTIDPLTNTLKLVSDLIKETPSLQDQIKSEEADKEAKKLKETLAEVAALPLKFELENVSQNLEIHKAIAVRDAKGDTLKLVKQTADLEIAALKEQITLSDKIAVNKIRNLSPEDLASGKGLIISAENQQNLAKIESQINLTRINSQKQQSDEARKLITDFRDTYASLKSVDNPLIRQMVEFETATERARLKFGAFGDLVVNKIAAIERANLTKAINLKNFENNLAALKFDQNARQLALMPETEFADFKRGLEKVSRTAGFTTTINSLNRQIQEADYYAGKYNPNNPKSFAEFNRRGPNDDISDVGLQIKSAVEDIRDLNNLSLSDTGIYGKGAVADKILAAIPSRDELLKRLNSPFAAADAQFLLGQQADALRAKRDFEKQKFRDFIEEQRVAEFGKVFAREQINLINGSNLTDIEKAQQRLSVTNSLGNDLDPALKRQAIQDSVTSANEKRNEEKKTAQNIAELKDLVAALVKQLAEKGINPEVPPAQVNLTLNGVEATVSQNPLPKSATSADVEEAYFNENDPNYRIGDSHKAGIYYGAKLR